MKRIKFKEQYPERHNTHIDKRRTVIVENLGTHLKMDEVMVSLFF
jgi:hypothetical protein